MLDRTAVRIILRALWVPRLMHERRTGSSAEDGKLPSRPRKAYVFMYLSSTH